MNITVYLGAKEGNDPGLKKRCKNWERGLVQVEMRLFMAARNPG